MRSTRFGAFWRFVLVATVIVAPIAAQERQTRERSVVVSVLDRAGKLATGLTPTDFVVREDGLAREVLKVETSTAPMQIAVLVDTSADTQILLRDVRLGVTAFASAVWSKSPGSDISLSEFGERTRQLAPATKSADALKTGIDHLFEHNGSGAYALDAIAEAAKALKTRNAAHPVIVVFARDSSQEFSPRQASAIEAALKDARAELWSLVLRNGPGQMSQEAIQRDLAFGDVSPRSGGTRELLLDQLGIEPAFSTLAARLSAQYVVTYGRPESLIPPTKLEVTSKRDGTRVLAPRWTGQ